MHHRGNTNCVLKNERDLMAHFWCVLCFLFSLFHYMFERTVSICRFFPCALSMFADDTCIHVSNACYANVLSTLQLSANEGLNWATNNFMTIHPQKTKYLIITTWQNHQRIPLSPEPIIINKHPIERVSHIRF